MTGLDFTSSSFLGLRHGSRTLPPWGSLTTGLPAVLQQAGDSERIGAEVAAMQGAEAGVVGRSALHALMDVMGMLPERGDTVAVDTAAYPLAWWAALRAAANGAVVRRYPHHRPDPAVLETSGRLFLLTDGWCAGCNRPAPLRALRRYARERGGVLVVDDSLAFGVLGHRSPRDAFGDGAGTPSWLGVHEGLVWVASMAKAYGAPLAVTTGDRRTIDRLARSGGNRVHSSPPSAADLAAATSALGDVDGVGSRRARLLGLVLHLRSRLRDLGLRDPSPPFPVVGIGLPSLEARRWWSRLRASGIQAVVQQSRCRGEFRLTVVVRADHSYADLERLAGALETLAVRRGAA